ncbi:MAG TPA: hypothetical protein VK989_05470 [Polyangia bacterium]|nr:hypothetical protein [Polyangia bacterium]
MIAAGLGIAVANIRTLGPLWASPALERSQKIVQTILMWLVPGSYLAVRQAVMTPGAERRPEDVTRGVFLGSVDDWDASRGAHHGHWIEGHDSVDGGHHGGFGDSHGGGHDGGGHDGH